MADVDVKGRGKGSDEKRYMVRLRGPGVYSGHSSSGDPEHVLTTIPHTCTVDRYNGTVTRLGFGKYRLEDTGVEITLDDPNIDPFPT